LRPNYGGRGPVSRSLAGVAPSQAVVSREQVAQAAPRALDEDDQRALLRAAGGARQRDRAIIVVLLHTALRLSEVVALDVDDVRISARKGCPVVSASLYVVTRLARTGATTSGRPPLPPEPGLRCGLSNSVVEALRPMTGA